MLNEKLKELDKGYVYGSHVVLGNIIKDNLLQEILDYDTRLFGYWYFNDIKWLDMVLNSPLIWFSTDKKLSPTAEIRKVSLNGLSKCKNYGQLNIDTINRYLLKMGMLKGKSCYFYSREETKKIIDNIIRGKEYTNYYGELLRGSLIDFQAALPHRKKDIEKNLDMSRMSDNGQYGIYANKVKIDYGYYYVSDGISGDTYIKEAKDINEEFARYLKVACSRFVK